MQKWQDLYLVRLPKLQVLCEIDQSMCCSRTKRHVDLYCFTGVQGQNVLIVVEDLLFFQIFHICLLQQVIPYLYYLVVVVDVSIHQRVEIRPE